VNSDGIGAEETIAGLDAMRIGEEEREAPAVWGNQILGGADADVRWSRTGVADKQSYNPRMPAQHFAKHFSEHQKVIEACIANDFGFGALFERQVEALAHRGDVVVGITTSGRSENVLRGLKAAKEKGAITIALCGKQGLQGSTADHVVAVPSNEGAYIQEVHLMLLHVWCIAIDAAIAEGGGAL